MANTATIEAHLRIIEGMYKELEKFAHDLQEVIDLSESCDTSSYKNKLKKLQKYTECILNGIPEEELEANDIMTD